MCRIVIARRRRLHHAGGLHPCSRNGAADGHYDSVSVRLRAWSTDGRAAILARLVFGRATGMLASAGWFTAMTVQNAAYVSEHFGQVELIFTLQQATWSLASGATALELLGIASVTSGILKPLPGAGSGLSLSHRRETTANRYDQHGM